MVNFGLSAQDFNSHAHVERDITLDLLNQKKKISTHTLTWSVTTTTETIEQDTGDFNSHAHVERDFSTSIVPSSYSISTHTLTWSVTSKLNAVVVHDIFQLTRSRGA